MHAVVAELSDDEIAILIQIQPVGKTKLTRGPTRCTHVADERAIELEHADAMIAGIGDVDQIVLNNDGFRARELAIGGAEASDLVEILRIGIEDADAIVVAVLGDVDPAMRVEGDIGWINKLP